MSGKMNGKWRIKGWKGQHDEEGASIVDENGRMVASTASIYEFSQDGTRNWEAYHRVGRLVESAPLLENELRRVLAGAHDLNHIKELLDKIEGVKHD